MFKDISIVDLFIVSQLLNVVVICGFVSMISDCHLVWIMFGMDCVAELVNLYFDTRLSSNMDR